MVPVIAVHGGMGAVGRQHDAGLLRALDAGYRLLEAGRPAVDAVAAAVVVLENDPVFNAGRGTARTSTGRIDLAASVMRGEDRVAGSVTNTSRLANPVLVARSVLHWSTEVALRGDDAEEFAFDHGFVPVADWHFGPSVAEVGGSVGAVALDSAGGLAAASSAGAAPQRPPGRGPDIAVIGAGTYANARCAVSFTGVAETLVRLLPAHEVALRVANGSSVKDACIAVLDDLTEIGGSGGCIALSVDGDVSAECNTPGFIRAWTDERGQPVVG